MEQQFKIEGMTCNGCRSTVEAALQALSGVNNATVSLEEEKAILTTSKELTVATLQKALPDKYKVSPLQEKKNVFKQVDALSIPKWKQLKPLYLIFLFITAASLLLHKDSGNWQAMMLDFMGLFYVVFSFFKLLDVRGFTQSFAMYDPLAKAVPAYAWVYPFIELGLGLLFLMRLQLDVALVATLVILGATTIGVIRVLLSKKEIQCACLGTALKLPMTQATFIENTVMIVMALLMLFA